MSDGEPERDAPAVLAAEHGEEDVHDADRAAELRGADVGVRREERGERAA